MKRIGIVVVLVGVGALILNWLISKPETQELESTLLSGSTNSAEATPPGQHSHSTNYPPGTPPIPLLGETLLEGYAHTNLPPENDLTLLSRLMDNSLLLLKSAANRPLSANEDWADMWRGLNATQERFLPDEHIALSASGQLVDRWQTPLFFHAEGGGRWSVRSAGFDQRMWTEDDLHRNADGSFRRGEELNPSSLWSNPAKPQ